MKISEKQIIQSFREMGKMRKNKKRLPQNIFYAMCEELLVCSAEIIPVNEKGEIYLLKRDSKDKYYPNLWHSPGTINLPNETVKETLKRVMEQELTLKFDLSRLVFVGIQEFNKGKGKFQDNRQQFRASIFLLQVESRELTQAKDRKFFAFNKTPSDSVVSQKNLLWPVVRKFLKDKTVRMNFAK